MQRTVQIEPRRGTRERESHSRDALALPVALPDLAVQAEKAATVDAVLETAGQGVLRLGLRLFAFQVTPFQVTPFEVTPRRDAGAAADASTRSEGAAGRELVLRHVATARSRADAVEQAIGRSLRGLRAPLDRLPSAVDVVQHRRVVTGDELDLFTAFLVEATGTDLGQVESGVLAPLGAGARPWGLLGIVSRILTPAEADAVAVFATRIGAAIELLEATGELDRARRDLASCREELARTKAELADRERLAALGELAAVVAHEVKNPLCVLFNSVGGLREFIRRGAPPGGAADAELFASIAVEEAGELRRIVSDLVELARPRAPELEVASLADVIEQVRVATAGDGRVRIDVHGPLPLLAMDAVFVRQAILNLVLGGLQAIAHDGTLTVRARAEEVDGRSFARIDVIDAGPGIPMRVRESVFAPFFTTRPTRTSLGLAMVENVVESHGGELSLDAGADGTRFTIWLPTPTSPRGEQGAGERRAD